MKKRLLLAALSMVNSGSAFFNASVGNIAVAYFGLFVSAFLGWVSGSIEE